MTLFLLTLRNFTKR